MLMPGVVPIVPGGYLYRCVRDIVCGQNASAIANIGAAAEIALGMAGGVVTLTILYAMLKDYVVKRKNGKKRC